MFRAMLLSATLLTCATLSLCAQVTIVKNGVAVPEEDVHLLFRTSCRVMTEEFHLDNACGVDFPVTPVLGDQNERVSGDELKQEYFIYMNQWNEAWFIARPASGIRANLLSIGRPPWTTRRPLRTSGVLSGTPHLH
jgi:hypothetical protein